MQKPKTISGYAGPSTINCERILLTLLRGLGPLKDSVFLVGGLVPQYLVPQQQAEVKAHAGTLDVDLVIDIDILTKADAYQTLEENLARMGFEPSVNKKHQFDTWRWGRQVSKRVWIYVDLLTDAPELRAAAVKPLPTEEGVVGALNVPHAALVFDMHETLTITGELLDENGEATETVRHADLISFSVLKARAYDQRHEPKDAYDLLYCLENVPEGLANVVTRFQQALAGPHGQVVANALRLMHKRFVTENRSNGYRQDGPVAVAKFEIADDQTAATREAWVLRQREVSALIANLLDAIGPLNAEPTADGPQKA